MSPVALVMDLLLAGLLVAAVVVGLRLNRRLKALRDGQAGFAAAVVELNQAAGRAEAGLAALRAASEEAHDSLLSRIETARALTQKLEAGTLRAEQAATSAQAAARAETQPSALANIAAMVAGEPHRARSSPRFPPVSVPPRAAPGSEPALADGRPPPAIIRRGRPAFDDDLFEAGAANEPLPLGPLDRAPPAFTPSSARVERP